MDRREALAATAAAVSLAAIGCTAGTGDGAGGGTPTVTRGGPDASEDVFVVLHNHLGESVTVSVTVTAGDAVLFDDRVTIEGDERGALHTGITETGRYELAVAIEDGSESRATFEFREYDVEMGSNLVVWIDEEIRLAKEA